MLLNEMICWTDAITTELCPYAIKLTIDDGNSCPEDSSLTALEHFSSTKGHARVKQYNTFGSPCFILDPKLCQKKSVPKWTPWSRQVVHIGISPQHAVSVALVLNLKTGYISPQFHILFDDDFTTTTARIKNKLPDNWTIFSKPSWTATRRITVQHREKMKNPNWPFRGRPQGKQKITCWPFRGRPQGKEKLTYWPFIGIRHGKQQLTYWPFRGITQGN